MALINGRERCEILADYVIDTGATVRNAAKHFGISKSTVHKDISYKLKYINPRLYNSVKEILEINKSERHLRGGEATRQKYLNKNKKGKCPTPNSR
jgi:putative DeoR family transcriptional regulator (stage III sporulation protein D)